MKKLKDIQYWLYDKSTNKMVGMMVGKTENNELVISNGNSTYKLKIDSKSEAKYEIRKVEVSS